jgi:hypothetical protein
MNSLSVSVRRFAVMVILIFGSPSIAAQESAEAPRVPKRVATLTAGVGNAMGWFGLQAERYLARERLSAFLGAGYTPSLDPGDPSGPTFAAGVRGYTVGFKHRGFLAFSVSQIFVETPLNEDPHRLYGPGLEVGYQFASRGGFTFMASVGLGYAPAAPEEASAVGELLGIGLGYTWRRQVRHAPE